MIPRLVIGSKNPDKTTEVKAILEQMGLADEIVEGLDWDDVEETGSSLEENALLKARAVVEATGLPAIADDTGLEVQALGGAPGVHTARFAGENAGYEDNRAKLLEMMAGEEQRDAVFRTVVALVFPDGVEVTAEGAMPGRISETSRGERNFGYDPIFEVDGRTLAEIEDEEKNEISHRALAIRALCESLGL